MDQLRRRKTTKGSILPSLDLSAILEKEKEETRQTIKELRVEDIDDDDTVNVAMIKTLQRLSPLAEQEVSLSSDYYADNRDLDDCADDGIRIDDMGG